jgi:hypothetical protein
MTLLQETISMTKEGMYVAAISSLVVAIVWLALYIRKMHQKWIDYLSADKEKMIEVIARNSSSAESQARSSDRLATTIDDLHKTILITNRRREP